LKTSPLHGERQVERIQNGNIDPTFIITHTLLLEQAPHGYDIFKLDDCEKVILKA
jgi:threonine dehydrogenase-like Zn-dependent dehydrogenase